MTVFVEEVNGHKAHGILPGKGRDLDDAAYQAAREVCSSKGYDEDGDWFEMVVSDMDGATHLFAATVDGGFVEVVRVGVA